MSKHTPGPWRVESELTIVGCDGYELACIPPPDDGTGARPAEDLANARVAAAAPALLAACKAAEAALNKLHSASMTSAATAWPALEIVVAAIKKAKGDEP